MQELRPQERKMQNLDCIGCGDPFVQNTKKQKFCCRACQLKSNGHKSRRERSNKHLSKLSPFLSHLLSLKGYEREKLSLGFLEKMYYEQKGLCAISKVPLTHIRGKGRVPTNISIDRIDNRVGYELDNVQLVCSLVNKMKSTSTEEQLKFWCRAILDGLSE